MYLYSKFKEVSMKILKILFILLVPAMGIVGCKKSELKPASPATASATPADNDNANARVVDMTTMDEGKNGGNTTNIVGTSDDDRDGGDKKKKPIVK